MDTAITKANVVIFDLDGCIANDEWRRTYISENPVGMKDYAEYHKRCESDSVFELGATMLRAHIAGNDFIAFCTARPFSVSEQTSAWIQKAFNITPVTDFLLLMRGDTDERSAVAVKSDQLQHLFNWTENLGRRITRAYDDRLDVVEYYLSRGVESVQLTGTAFNTFSVTAAYNTPHTHEQRVQYAPGVEPVVPPPPVIQYPTTPGLPISDNRDTAGYDLGGAALHQNLPISATDFIVANGFSYLEGSAIRLIAEWHIARDQPSRDPARLSEARELLWKAIELELKDKK